MGCGASGAKYDKDQNKDQQAGAPEKDQQAGAEAQKTDGGEKAEKIDGSEKAVETATVPPPAATAEAPKAPSKEPPEVTVTPTPADDAAPKAVEEAPAAAPAPAEAAKQEPAEAPKDEATDASKPEALCEVEQAKIDAMKNRGHREGVSAASISPEDLVNFVKPVYEKTEAESAKLSLVLSSNAQMRVLAGCLEGEGLQDVINAFFLKEVDNGKDVIRQGDEGDCLYICEAGELEVFVSRPDPLTGVQASGKGSKVLTVGPGALFGELALMYSAPRAATITVSSDTATLWALERDAFKALLMSHAATKIEPYHGYLKEVEILKVFNKHELGQINELATSTLYDSDEVIVNQGESGDNFFIVEEGTCSAYMAGDSGEKEVKQYNQGEYFGEVALLNGEPRRATVRATGQGCSVLSFPKDVFDKSFVPIFDSLKKSMDGYGAYESFPGV